MGWISPCFAERLDRAPNRVTHAPPCRARVRYALLAPRHTDIRRAAHACLSQVLKTPTLAHNPQTSFLRALRTGRERTSFERNRGGAMVVMRGASLRVQSQVVLAPWVPIRWSPNVTFLENTTPTPARAKSRSISTFTHGARSGARERRAQHLKPLKSDAYIPHGHVLHSRTCVENETHIRSVRPHS